MKISPLKIAHYTVIHSVHKEITLYKNCSHTGNLLMLATYNLINCVYGFHCVTRLTFVQHVTTSDMALYGRECGNTNVEFRVLASANI